MSKVAEKDIEMRIDRLQIANLHQIFPSPNPVPNPYWHHQMKKAGADSERLTDSLMATYWG